MYINEHARIIILYIYVEIDGMAYCSYSIKYVNGANNIVNALISFNMNVLF